MNHKHTLPEIIDEISHTLRSSPLIHAMWLEGSYATGKSNGQSDIDVWLDVEDGSFDECISIFRDALSAAASIDHESNSKGVYSLTPKLQKHIFYLEGFSPDNCIELDLQENSRNFDFSHTEHAIKVLFDKNGVMS